MPSLPPLPLLLESAHGLLEALEYNDVDKNLLALAGGFCSPSRSSPKCSRTDGHLTFFAAGKGGLDAAPTLPPAGCAREPRPAPSWPEPYESNYPETDLHTVEIIAELASSLI